MQMNKNYVNNWKKATWVFTKQENRKKKNRGQECTGENLSIYEKGKLFMPVGNCHTS